MGLGKIPSGSGRALRLDPLTLPVRFAAEDAAADEATRHIELHSERVVLRRAVRGMRIAVNLPVTTFLGLAVRHADADGAINGEASILMQHRDPALSVPLFVASGHDDEVTALSETWARVLGLPLLPPDAQHQQPRARAPRVVGPLARRLRRGALKSRRPSILLRRKPGQIGKEPKIHREHEIIARN
jgi:hypothetical protein